MSLSPHTANYPKAVPTMIFPEHLKTVGFHEHIQNSVRDLINSSMLFQLFSAAKEWIDSHPFSISATPITAPTSTPSSSGSKAPSQNVCKFFMKGACRYGNKCKNYHPDPKQGTLKQPQAEDRATVVPEASRDMVLESSHHESKEPASVKSSAHTYTPEAGSSSSSGKKQSMRTATDVISRVLWDPDIKTEHFTVGYLDRFVGVIEKPFTAFSWEDLSTVGANVLAVPKHRIQYFKYRDEIVWDKPSQLDNVFGSRGGKLIQDVIQAQQAAIAAGAESANKTVKDNGDKVEKSTSASKYRNQDERPTHFICIRITDKDILSNVAHIQSEVVSHSPHLSEGCLPLTALHVTVCMVKLDSASHLEIAKSVLKNTARNFVQYLPRCAEIVFTGVDNFRERLIYAKAAPNPALDKFSSFLIERFERAGLKTPGNHAQYTPHMTLVKMSRPMQHATNTSVISADAYSQFRDMLIGKQCVAGIHLCSMTEAKQVDGFYKWFDFTSNSVLNSSPLARSVFSKCVRLLQESGTVQDKEAAGLLRAIDHADSNDTDIDKAVQSLQQLIQNQTISNPLAAKVVVLRGLPGSGKSHLSRNCSESLENKATICSADDYFTQSDHYNFVQGSLPEAHSQCYENFLQALIDGKKLVVIDNTNSMLWEYRNYTYLCKLLDIQCHVLEIPHPNQQVVSGYCDRNQHKVDMASIASYTKRWEEDKQAMLVPPRLAYPQSQGQNNQTISLLNLCQPGYLPKEMLESPSALYAVYTGVFLTPKSQWKLLSAIPPTHPNIQADHVTLLFEPSLEALQTADIGKKVSVNIKALADSDSVQAVTVALPQGLASDNHTPHVTLSTDEASAPKLANMLLQSRSTTPLSQPLKLNGVVGVVVREATPEQEPGRAVNFHTILSKKHFCEVVLPRVSNTPAPSTPPREAVTRVDSAKKPHVTDASVSICTGDQKVTELCVFDFDGTLFDTPDPVSGRQYYEEQTGQRWPHRGWLSRPESLLPPLKVRAGPALADFRRHIGRAGSYVVVLTARITQTRSGVQTVLDDHQLHPHQVIFKPGDTRQATKEFKVQILGKLLEQFPDVMVVKFWDDRDDNLQAVRSFSKRPGNRKIRFEITDSTTSLRDELRNSTLGSLLTSQGLLPTREHTSAAETGLRFISEQFCGIIGYQGDPAGVTCVFGSHPLGRVSDVDLCLVTPPGHTHSDLIEGLAEQLEKCGITHVHKGYSSRCPRLKVMLQFRESPSVDYDIVFAVLPSQEAFTAHVQAQGAGLLTAEDSQSKTALTGVTLISKVREIISGVISTEIFGAIVEMTVQVLRAARKKGNFYHYIRSFHVVMLLADCVEKNTHLLSTDTDCDTLFELFLAHVAQLTPESWLKVFTQYVPVAPEYVPQQTDVFHTLSETVRRRDISLAARYEELLMRPVFPPRGYMPVWLLSEGGEHVDQWKLRTLLEAKLPTFIQQLLSRGLQVVLDGNGVHSSFCFAVQETPNTKHTLQLVFRKFWNEFSEYRNRKDIRLELKFSRTSDTEDLAGGDKVCKQVEEFAGSERTDLHMPSSLTSYERLLVHETAERLGLKHKTIDQENKRHIYLHK